MSLLAPKNISYVEEIVNYFASHLGSSMLLPLDVHAEIFGRLSLILCVRQRLPESAFTIRLEETFLVLPSCLKCYADCARRYQRTLVLSRRASSSIYASLIF